VTVPLASFPLLGEPGLGLGTVLYFSLLSPFLLTFLLFCHFCVCVCVMPNILPLFLSSECILSFVNWLLSFRELRWKMLLIYCHAPSLLSHCPLDSFLFLLLRWSQCFVSHLLTS
jgi:hypothetical protein